MRRVSLLGLLVVGEEGVVKPHIVRAARGARMPFTPRPIWKAPKKKAVLRTQGDWELRPRNDILRFVWYDIQRK